MYSHILIPTDGSTLAEQAVVKGLELAKALGAAVTVMTVVEPFHLVTYAMTGEATQLSDRVRAYERQAAGQAKVVLDAAASQASAAGVAAETVAVEADHPSEAIIRTAGEKGADLIVMASHGRRGMAALVLGSETTKVLTHSKIPVLVLR